MSMNDKNMPFFDKRNFMVNDMRCMTVKNDDELQKVQMIV